MRLSRSRIGGRIKTPAGRLVYINPMKVRFMGFDEATIERFWSKVDKRGPDECWEWQAAKTKGYGVFCANGMKNGRAHRIALGMAIGWEAIKGKSVCHTCDNRACANPKHLYAGDAKTNIMDCIKRNRWKKLPSRYGPDNKNTKLKESQVAYIKLLLANGYGDIRIGQWYGVSRGSIRQIRLGQAWQWVEKATLRAVGSPQNAKYWSRRTRSA